MKKLLAILLFISSFGFSNAQMTISDVTIPATLKAGSADLVLNGAGLREKLFFDLYVGGLFLKGKSADADKIIQADEEMGIRIHMISKLVTSDNMSKATREGFEKSTGGNVTPLQDKIDTFIKVFSQEEIVSGNIFDLVYAPGTGVTVSKNGKVQATIEGLEFKKALFGIWLCNDPADDSLKDDMLGK